MYIRCDSLNGNFVIRFDLSLNIPKAGFKLIQNKSGLLLASVNRDEIKKKIKTKSKIRLK